MLPIPTYNPIDYLLVGHLTKDLLPDGGSKMGGTASFSGLTASALGHKVGLVTSCTNDIDLAYLDAFQLHVELANTTTTFRNIHTPFGRKQYMFDRAKLLDEKTVPLSWRSTPIVHLGPIAGEVDPEIFKIFPDSLLCLTLQGWLRGFDEQGKVSHISWPGKHDLLKASHAAVVSLEDVDGSEEAIDEIAAMCKLLVVTDNHNGARVHWNGDVHTFPAPEMQVVEDTGAGDIFAACFFHRLFTTKDPWEAARFAVQLSAQSVTRVYFESVPTEGEIERAKVQIL